MHKIRKEQVLQQFGANLKKLRNEKRISQEELAHKAGIALSQVARIETGKLNTSICTIYAIAEALEVHPGALFEGKKEQ